MQFLCQKYNFYFNEELAITTNSLKMLKYLLNTFYKLKLGVIYV